MNIRNTFVFAAASAVLLLSSAVVARELNRATIRLDDKVTVDGKALDSGRYIAEWDGNGPDVQVTLHQGKNTVAQFPAKITEQTITNPQDAYGVVTQPDGSRALKAIYPAKKRIALEVEQTGTSEMSHSQPSK